MATPWIEVETDSGFGLDNLPYGVFARRDGSHRLGVRIGNRVLDLRAAADAGLVPPEGGQSDLNPLMAAGPTRWAEMRAAIIELLVDASHEPVVRTMLEPVDAVAMAMPFRVGDWVDFYSSEQHATNVGRMFRPDQPPLLPNWKHLPVGYHGRAGTVVVSGTPIPRPAGQRRGDDGPVFGPSTRLDIELEMGFVVGPATSMGEPVPIGAARDFIFGMVLVNDWSARDIQAWEYQPLGPFLGKSFATTISPWVVPLAAMEPLRVSPPPQDPQPLPYLRTDEPWGFDVDLEVLIQTSEMRRRDLPPHRVAQTNVRDMYWTAAQQLAHLTVNGAALRTGDLCGSGTISGSDPGGFGSFLELSWNGTRPLTLPDGSERTFLEDGDEVSLRGRGMAGSAIIDFGEAVGRVVASG